jgi:hypothetical protein
MLYVVREIAKWRNKRNDRRGVFYAVRAEGVDRAAAAITRVLRRQWEE